MKITRHGVAVCFAWCAVVVTFFLIAALVSGFVIYSRYEERAEQFDLTHLDQVSERSEVYDGNGEFYGYFGGQNRLVVSLDQVAPSFIKALVAREDSRFWQHSGVDFKGVARALVANLRARDTRQGGSTITQQLARNACGLSGRSIDRKALEAMLARRIEASFTKEQILTLYVNRIYFGAGFYGIEAASRGYFGKPASQLTLGESATLAALICSPNRFSPARDLAAAVEQRDTVLDRMLELQMISGEERAAAKAQQLHLAKGEALHVTDDAVMDAVQRDLAGILAPETLERGGLRVHMTIDPQLQRLAEAAADRRLSQIEAAKGYPHPRKADYIPAPAGEDERPTEYLQAAVVIIENATGAIRAAVPGRDYSQSKYSRALVSRRQLGSTFKPFVYAAAYDHGLLPVSLVDDGKIASGEFRDISAKWSPANSDGEYGGPQPAAFGLLKSRNTMSVRVGEFVGLPRVRQLAKSLSLAEEIPDFPVVFLGAFEATVRDVTAAYTVFPNLGTYRPPFLIAKIEDHDGQTLWKHAAAERQVVSAESAHMVSSTLGEVMKTGTAAKAASLGWKKKGAGKTGTTNDFFDAWFVGYTSSLTCGVWVGLDKPQTIMEKGYGSALALPVWVDVMQQVPENKYPAGPFRPPGQLTKAALCSISGARATSACIANHLAYEMELPASRVPTQFCRTHPEPAPQIVSYDLPPSASGGVFADAPSATSAAPATNAPTATTSIRPPASSGIYVAPDPRPSTVSTWGNRDYRAPQTMVRRTVDGVEVRRAVPVDRSSYAPPEPQTQIEAPSEQRTVEILPDGRTRTRIIRTYRTR